MAQQAQCAPVRTPLYLGREGREAWRAGLVFYRLLWRAAPGQRRRVQSWPGAAL